MKTFRLFAFFIACAILFAGCSAVPVTGRKQMLLVSDQEVLASSFTQYNDYIKTAKLSSNKAKTQQVERVGKKIAVATENYLKQNGMTNEVSNFKWEFKLVQDKQVNAFCMPGGKIVVYEGLLPLAPTDEELAVVIGHEVAHAVAKHANERMSQQMMTQVGSQALGKALANKSSLIQNAAAKVYGLGSQLGIMLPYSRKHEYEADYMGMVFMKMAGYSPNATLSFWQKMSANSGGGSIEFLSTHPSDINRINEIKRRLPELAKIK